MMASSGRPIKSGAYGSIYIKKKAEASNRYNCLAFVMILKIRCTVQDAQFYKCLFVQSNLQMTFIVIGKSHFTASQIIILIVLRGCCWTELKSTKSDNMKINKNLLF